MFDEEGFTMETQGDAFRASSHFALIVIHLAPPCSTFSKARDRGRKTRVRSYDQPGGFRPRGRKVLDGNVMAKEAINFAVWAHAELHATVTMENPDKSYLWLYGLPWFGHCHTYSDVRMSYCRYGKKYQKNTRFRVWGRSFAALERLCTKRKGKWACGNALHQHLGWGEASTQAAAVYPHDLCRAYAACLSDMEKTETSA